MFAASAFERGLDRELRQSSGSLPLVIGGTAHVGVGLGDVHYRLANFLDKLRRDGVAA